MREIGRTNADDHAPFSEVGVGGERQLVTGEADNAPATSASMRFIDGEPMKRGDEQVRRMSIQLLRRVDLLQHAVPHAPRFAGQASSLRPGRA